MLESRFKTNLINELEYLFPGCFIIHMDPNEYQGISDLLILYQNKWAMLEGKRYRNSTRRPNQNYYINKFNEMSFARFIDQDNKEEVLYELQQAFRT